MKAERLVKMGRIIMYAFLLTTGLPYLGFDIYFRS